MRVAGGYVCKTMPFARFPFAATALCQTCPRLAVNVRWMLFERRLL